MIKIYEKDQLTYFKQLIHNRKQIQFCNMLEIIEVDENEKLAYC